MFTRHALLSHYDQFVLEQEPTLVQNFVEVCQADSEVFSKVLKKVPFSKLEIEGDTFLEFLNMELNNVSLSSFFKLFDYGK